MTFCLFFMRFFFLTVHATCVWKEKPPLFPSFFINFILFISVVFVVLLNFKYIFFCICICFEKRNKIGFKYRICFTRYCYTHAFYFFFICFCESTTHSLLASKRRNIHTLKYFFHHFFFFSYAIWMCVCFFFVCSVVEVYGLGHLLPHCVAVWVTVTVIMTGCMVAFAALPLLAG